METVIVIVIFWLLWLLVLPIAVGIVANEIGRSFIKYFIVSIFLTPVFALLSLIILGKTNRKIARDEIEIESVKAELQAGYETAAYEYFQENNNYKTTAIICVMIVVAIIVWYWIVSSL